MKTKIIVALVAIAALCVGAYYFFTKINIEPPIPHSKTNSIIGNWKIDSVYNSKDSNGLAYLIFALSDSALFKFDTDSTLQIVLPKETETQHYVFNNDSLIVKGKNELDTFVLRFDNDSLFYAIAKDSSVLRLRKIDSIYLKERRPRRSETSFQP